MPNSGDGDKIKRELDAAQAKLVEMQALARRHGLPIPKTEDVAPQVNLNWDLRRIADELGQVCSGHDIFRAEKEVVTVDEKTGRAVVMDGDRFRTWVLEYCVCWKKWDREKGCGVPDTLGCEAARGVLKSDVFQRRLRELRGVNVVRQPILRDGKVALLPLGYDMESGIFTLKSLDYDTEMDSEEAVKFLRRLFGTFPWADDNGRSLAVHMAAFFTVYCQAMMPPGTLTPLFVYNANEPGSGKSILVKVILQTIFGRAGTTSIGDNEEELRKRLDACAQHLLPALFFDDESGYVSNKLLNAWLTARSWEGRILGTHKWFYMPKRAITFLCGNGVTVSADLGRRMLLADLFAKNTLADRELPEDTILITDDWLDDPINRGRILSALWAVVRYSYSDVPKPKVKQGKEVASFETWCRVIPRIVQDGAWADPLKAPDLPDAGNRGTMEFQQLLQLVVKKLMPVPAIRVAQIKLAEMVPIARGAGLFVEILNTTEMMRMELDGRGKRGWKEAEYPAGEFGVTTKRLPETDEEKDAQAAEWCDQGILQKFRARFKGHLGQTVRIGGEEFQFGQRKEARNSTFTVIRL